MPSGRQTQPCTRSKEWVRSLSSPLTQAHLSYAHPIHDASVLQKLTTCSGGRMPRSVMFTREQKAKVKASCTCLAGWPAVLHKRARRALGFQPSVACSRKRNYWGSQLSLYNDQENSKLDSIYLHRSKRADVSISMLLAGDPVSGIGHAL